MILKPESDFKQASALDRIKYHLFQNSPVNLQDMIDTSNFKEGISSLGCLLAHLEISPQGNLREAKLEYFSL